MGAAIQRYCWNFDSQMRPLLLYGSGILGLKFLLPVERAHTLHWRNCEMSVLKLLTTWFMVILVDSLGTRQSLMLTILVEFDKLDSSRLPQKYVVRTTQQKEGVLSIRNIQDSSRVGFWMSDSSFVLTDCYKHDWHQTALCFCYSKTKATFRTIFGHS